MDTLGGQAGRWAHQGTGAHALLELGMPAPAPQRNQVRLASELASPWGEGGQAAWVGCAVEGLAELQGP
jgi:hypothetical protein